MKGLSYVDRRPEHAAGLVSCYENGLGQDQRTMAGKTRLGQALDLALLVCRLASLYSLSAFGEIGCRNARNA